MSIPDILANPAVARLLDVLDGEGEETRIAGGAVRDALIGRRPAEIDLATTSLPETVIARAEKAGLKAVPTGIAHGTVTLIVDGRPFEVTTLRRDVETDGRHAKVAFGRDWAEDAQRRDFTINGLFLDRAGTLHDLVGGAADLEAGRVRFIGDARTRIREDFLRILRFFRFFAGFGRGAPDAEAMAAAIGERHGLEHLSRERVRAELLKLLAAPGAPAAVHLMADVGLMGMVLGGVARPRRLEHLAEIEAKLGRAPDPVLRLGALALFIPDNVERLRDRLRLSNGETARLLAMAAREPRLAPDMSEQERKAALYRLGPEAYRDRVRLAWADGGPAPDDPAWRELVSLPEHWAAPKLPIAAKDLLDRGVEKGPELGAALARAEEAWIATGFPEDPAAVDTLIRQATKN